MKGFTLIEIIVSVAIFMMIATVITGSIIFLTDVYQRSEDMIELFQSGRVVLDGASREIRQAETITTPLPDSEEYSVSEITFKDGHLEDINKEGTARDGEGRFIHFSDGSERDNFYKDSYIKIISGPQEAVGETRKIVSYDGDERVAELDFSLGVDDYFGLDYFIDTSHYYINYRLEEGLIKRDVFSYYFSNEPNRYVSSQDAPPEGEALEKEVFESRTVGDYFSEFLFWEDEGINILVELESGERRVKLFKKVVGRNL